RRPSPPHAWHRTRGTTRRTRQRRRRSPALLPPVFLVVDLGEVFVEVSRQVPRTVVLECEMVREQRAGPTLAVLGQAALERITNEFAQRQALVARQTNGAGLELGREHDRGSGHDRFPTAII